MKNVWILAVLFLIGCHGMDKLQMGTSPTYHGNPTTEMRFRNYPGYTEIFFSPSFIIPEIFEYRSERAKSKTLKIYIHSPEGEVYTLPYNGIEYKINGSIITIFNMEKVFKRIYSIQIAN